MIDIFLGLTLISRKSRTRDMGGDQSTNQFTRAVLDKMNNVG